MALSIHFLEHTEQYVPYFPNRLPVKPKPPVKAVSFSLWY